MVLIPRQAQTSIKDFLNHLGTDNLSIYYQNELQYGQLNRRFINQFSDSHFQDVLDTISNKNKDAQSDWEIRKGYTLLLGNNQNQFDLAVGSSRLEQGVKDGEFSLGQALTGYWLIEEQLTDLSQADEQIPYYSSLKTSRDLLSTLENDNNLELTNQQPSSIFSTTNQRQNSNEPISSHQDNSSIDWLDTEISQPISIQEASQSNQSDFFQHQVFLHHLFSQLSQQKKLQYHQGKAILTVDGETLVAQLNEHNQWEYVSGTLSSNSLNQLQYELISFQDSLKSSPYQSSDFTL